MMTASTLLDAYIDINVLLIFACLLWFASAAALRTVGLSHAVTARLRLLRWGFLAVAFAPLFAAGMAEVARLGVMPADYSVNLTDFIVAQYLQGRFDMNPSVLERTLSLRADLTAEVMAPAGRAGLVLVGILLVGAVVFALRFACSVLRLRRVLADSYVWRRFGRLELRLSDTVAVPFSTRGLRRRFVVLPSAMLAREGDRRIALAHELQHLRQGDVEWEIALELLKPFFFWNPAFYLWKNQVEVMRELSCDRAILIRRGYDVAAYCQCLLSVCRDSLRRRRLLSVGLPAVALVRTENRPFATRSASLLRRRMVSLIDGKAEPRSTSLSLLLLVPVVGVTLLAALAIQPPGDWSQDRLMLSTIINLERLEAINGPVPSFGSPGW